MRHLDPDDVFYVASLVEFTARKTTNRRSAIARTLGVEGFAQELEIADTSHCLSFEQVADEIIARYRIMQGQYDTVSTCLYTVPTHMDIGKVYRRLVLALSPEESGWAETLYWVFLSPTADEISNFNSSFFFAPPEEVLYYHRLWMQEKVCMSGEKSVPRSERGEGEMCEIMEELLREVRQETRLNLFCSLVKDGKISLSVAVEESELSEDAFRAEMQKRYPDWQG